MSGETEAIEARIQGEEPSGFARAVDNFRLAKDELVSYLGTHILGGGSRGTKKAKEVLLPTSDARPTPSPEN